ncbi:MAG TPA: GNAT family N-acetyltransferase [Methylomirabilota bacterium]|nr:GNAT family N-acetyltransferase [Methylomirabilota bacterium]
MDGRVLQVNISPGGVPKLPVERAWVGELGLDGDRHRHDTVHGGPHRAVALLGIEAIERVQADGHPIEPGSVGENLTTTGIELARLAPGTRLAIGERLVLEISAPANPCDVIAGSFRNGKSGRISILTHPADSRMYARTVIEGEVQPGDSIRVLPPADAAAAALHLLLERIDAVTLDFEVGLWRAAAEAGFDVRVEDSGELAMAASPELPSSTFNRALGHRILPNLTDRMRDFFERSAAPGWIVADTPPWPGAAAADPSVVFAREVREEEPVDPGFGSAALADGLTIRLVDSAEADRWTTVLVEASGIRGRERDAWFAIGRRLVGSAGKYHLLVEDRGEPVGVAGLFTRRRVGLLATMAVLPAARGRGIQRALIAERIRLAIERRSTTVTASALVGSASARNLEAMGFRPIHQQALYRFDPAAHRAPPPTRP